MEINHFTPGQPILRGLPLALYRPATPAGALEPYLEVYTQPGDLVIDLFCQGPTLLREAVQAGRRALGLNVNRALLLAASLGLTAVERQQVEAAFTHLAQARKGPETLQAYVEGLYRTTCAACGATTVADAFVWERDEGAPLAKRYRCAACGETGEAPADEADRAAAARFEARGLSYWLLLDRATPSGLAYRERVAGLLDLYTPRNLAAVGDLLLKSDGLKLSPPVRRVLDALLLDTLDQATSLRAPDGLGIRPRRPLGRADSTELVAGSGRGLQRPARYVEANVWRLLERALEAWRETTPDAVPQAPDLDTLLAGGGEVSSYLAPLSARWAGRDLPLACAALIVVDPPRPALALWHLTALWSGWLWGQQAIAPLAPFLEQRRLDWHGFWRGLRGALAAVAPLLRPEGRLVGLFAGLARQTHPAKNPTTLEALALAAAAAGYDLTGWGARLPEIRLVYQIETPRDLAPVQADTLSRAVAERAAQVSLDTLRARGEPTPWPVLHTAIYADLAQGDLLARAAALPGDAIEPLSFLADTVRSALAGAPLRQLVPESEPTTQQTTQPLWWLDAALESEAAAPLSDRVELAVAETLRDLLAVTEADLDRRVCARFPGPETPDAILVRLCLFSYGDEHAAGHWRLRAEDDLEARVAETDAVIADLETLGRRLGFDVVLGVPSAGEWALRWLDAGGSTSSPRVLYAFAVRTTAVLGDLLFDPPPFSSPSQAGGKEGEAPEPATIPCLTLPGGRAVLVGHKLRHDPRLRQQVARHGWQFLKFRHLRHLVQEVAARQLDRHAFRAALGLDPIVEQVEAQMSLW